MLKLLARRRLMSMPPAYAGLIAAVMVFMLLGSAPLRSSGQSAGDTAAAQQPRNEPVRPILPVGPQDRARTTLGRILFEDPRLSHDGSRSCATCHQTATNGADALARDGAAGGGLVSKNTNTVFNATLSFRLDWAGDARSLEDQAAASLQHPELMATTPEEAVEKLRADPTMVRRFEAAYGAPPDWNTLLDALASYERTLVTPDSRFDQWLNGKDDALSVDEMEGYRLFKSAGCVSCHQGVNVGGNLFEKNGIFRPLLRGGTGLMRVPSLRNVAVTPPYFHDGSVADLGAAVQDMAEAQLGRSFTDRQLNQIVSFLGTLTGRYEGRLLRKPSP